MPGKYSPLEEYLRNLPAGQREVKLSFTQIEGILKSKLPASAQEQSWWANTPFRPSPYGDAADSFPQMKTLLGEATL